jgi:hypothetical protein
MDLCVVVSDSRRLALWSGRIAYDDVNSPKHSFRNLSHKQTMFGNASDLVAVKLMPLEAKFRKPIQAGRSFKVTDMSRRLVAFHDSSEGKITSRHWNSGMARNRRSRIRLHAYALAGEFTVIPEVEGPAGKSRSIRFGRPR